MTIALRQSTASQEIPLGHFVDSTDGVTAETGLTIANTDIKIWKAGATTLADKNSGGATHISGGIYYAVLDATDTDTVGSLVIFCAVSGALAVRLECQVYEEEVYDDLFAASAVGYLKPIVAGRDLDVTASGYIQNVVDVDNVAAANVTSVGADAIDRGSFTADTGLQSIRSATAQAGAAGTITLDASASAVDDFYNETLIFITDGTGVGQSRMITDYVGSTKVATIAPNWATNPGATSTFAILPQGGTSVGAYATNMIPLMATVQGRTLDVTATGAAGIDWGNIENKTTVNDLTDTSILTASALVVPIALIDSNVDAILLDTAEIGTAGAGLTSLPWNAAWDAEVQSEVQDAIEVNHLDHLLAVDYDPASKPGTATALLNELIENDGGVSRYTANALEQAPSGSGASASAIADAVWDEALSGHLSAGSTGEALNAAGSAGDPWTTTLPGSYTGSQAGKMLSDVLTDTGTTLQAELDGIQADTEDIQSRLPAALVGGRIDANVGAISADATAADNAESFFDGTGYAGTGNVIPTVTSVTGIASGGITAASIATGAIDADALAADAVDEILDEVVESTITLRQVCRLILSMMNKTTRSGSTIYFRDVADSKNRIAITIDSNADRTAVTRDLT